MVGEALLHQPDLFAVSAQSTQQIWTIHQRVRPSQLGVWPIRRAGTDCGRRRVGRCVAGWASRAGRPDRAGRAGRAPRRGIGSKDGRSCRWCCGTPPLRRFQPGPACLAVGETVTLLMLPLYHC